MNTRLVAAVIVLGLASGNVLLGGKESLPSLKPGLAPQLFEELWPGSDTRAEPLEVETLKEWEEDGAVLRVVRNRCFR